MHSCSSPIASARRGRTSCEQAADSRGRDLEMKYTVRAGQYQLLVPAESRQQAEARARIWLDEKLGREADVANYDPRRELPAVDPMSIPFTARHIVKAYDENDYFGGIIHGPPRSGKSGYVIRIEAIVYGQWEKARAPNGDKITMVFEDGMKWDAWKVWMRFTPPQLIDMIEYAQRKGRQQILGALDDAGVSAANYSWQEDFGKAINTYANVQASDFASLLYTTPDPRWLLTHIKNMPGGHTGRINKYTGDPYAGHIRYCRMYVGWISPDFKKSGVKPLYNDWFSKYLPDRVYQEYNPVRRTYANLAKDQVKRSYYRMLEKGQAERAERFRSTMEKKVGIRIVTDEEEQRGEDAERAELDRQTRKSRKLDVEVDNDLFERPSGQEP